MMFELFTILSLCTAEKDIHTRMGLINKFYIDYAEVMNSGENEKLTTEIAWLKSSAIENFLRYTELAVFTILSSVW